MYSITSLAIPKDNKYGTPFDIILNFVDKGSPSGKANSTGNDCIANASETLILLGK